MAYLSDKTPYVLAAIGNSACCPNTATAYGALGGSVEGKRLLVHGCGGVGHTVAKLLVKHGAAEVHTMDRLAARADIDGCVNVTQSHADSWWTGEYDAIVP